MQRNSRWNTKADILEDLAEVTGGYTDVDEKFIVVGEKPPPVRRYEDDDDEFNLRFGACVPPYEMQEDKGPDLKGITKFLRMVEEQEDQTTENGVSLKDQKDSVITISKLNPQVPKISKLNPNVPEFVPKGAIESSPRIKESSNVSANNSENEDEKRNNENHVKNNANIDNDIAIDKKIDVSKLNADEIKDISRKLRDKISDVSKKDDLRTKKEKNVAIAALLKLHTAPQSKEPEEKGTIKLFTPEYFATCPAAREVRCEIHDVIVNVDSKQQSSSDVSADKISKDSDLSEKSTTQTISSVEDDTSTQSGKSSPKSYIETPNEMSHYPHDPNVQKSIKKVTSWLQKPESPKPKGPVVCLGPISFKKKGGKSSASEESMSRSSSSLNVNANQIGHFVPSKRAEDLSKKYSERGRAIERRSEDIWTRAMNEMKAIDKKKLEQSTSQSDSREDVGSSTS